VGGGGVVRTGGSAALLPSLAGDGAVAGRRRRHRDRCWWLAGAAVTLKEAAPLDELTKPDWVGVGARHGLIGLAALTAAASAGAWSIRRPARPAVEHALIVPVASFAYLIAEALDPPYVMWAWIGLSAALAAVVHVPEVRRRIGI